MGKLYETAHAPMYSGGKLGPCAGCEVWLACMARFFY